MHFIQDPVLLIQKIRTNAAKKSYLFYTAQGIVLVIGNVLTNKNTTNANYTAIYRFNPIAEQVNTCLKDVYSQGSTEELV